MAKCLFVFFVTLIAPAVVISKTFLDENGHPHECSVCPDNQIIRSPCSAFKDTVCGSLYVHDFKEPSNDRFLDEIQEDYPLNLTYKMEQHIKGITRTDEWFGERMMNGMFASTFDVDPSNPDQFWVHHHWRSYDHNDEEFAVWLFTEPSASVL